MTGHSLFSRLRRLKRSFRLDRSRLKKLESNHRTLSSSQSQELANAIQEHHFKHHSLGRFYDDAERQSALRDLMDGRMLNARSGYLPWLDSVLPLAKAKILEIGCGSGPSTVAMAEQGAEVTGVDVEDEYLKLARIRLDLFRLQARLLNITSSEYQQLPEGSFDAVIFFATFEHLYLDERIEGVKLADRLIRPGGFIITIECPNRLWHFDDHTALLPFFHWLPDELAFRYSVQSPRRFVSGLGTQGDSWANNEFIRSGRGASYHEYQLGLGDRYPRYRVVSSVGTYERSMDLIQYARGLIGRDASYSRMLRSLCPDLHPAFTEQHLNFALQKPA